MKKDLVWTEIKCVELIKEFQARKALWSSGSKNYYDKPIREEQWLELAEIFEKDVDEIKKKMESLRGSFRREKARIRRSMQDGKGKYTYVKF